MSAVQPSRKPKRPWRRKPVDDIEVVFEPDVTLLAESVLGPAPDLRRGHYVLDPDLVRGAVGDVIDGHDAEPATSTEEEARCIRLRRLASDPDALYRPHLVADTAMIERLLKVQAQAPNARDAIDIIIGAARISACTGAPLTVPPILLVGPPGSGKTHFIRTLLGPALRVPVLEILGSTMVDGSPIVGTPVGWRGAGPGRLAEILLASATSAALIVVEEIEKMRLWNRGENAADLLLGLLDGEMAAAHEDQFFRLPMRADRAIWSLAANSLDGLSRPLLDRCIIIPVEPTSREERRDIVRRIHAATRSKLGLGAMIEIDDDSIDALADLSLRRTGSALTLALGRAVAAGRNRCEPDDIRWARAIVARGDEPARPRMGFRA